MLSSKDARRRRQCENGRHRWTTIEVVEARALAAERVARAVLDAASELAEEK